MAILSSGSGAPIAKRPEFKAPKGVGRRGRGPQKRAVDRRGGKR